MPLAAGDRLGPYIVERPLGAGGMGEVYRARDSRLDRTVAIKVLPAQFASDPDSRQRFEREARAVAALSHPNICPLFDVGRHEGIDFLVMEHLEGETLAQRLEKGPLPLDQALARAIEISDALNKAHRHGIVHRDLKPGNVMLTKSGAKLLDFGLAKLRGPAEAGHYEGGNRGVRLQPDLTSLPTTPPNLTVQGTILGTFQYMSPEQLDGQEADARSDIFAFGALVYEMLTGRRAFEGKTQASVIGAILGRDPAPMSTLQPQTPALLDHIVRRCLAKDPDARWQSAGDVYGELKWVLENPATPTATVAVSDSVAPGRKSRERMAWALTTLAVLLAALAVPATVYFRGTAPDPVVTRLDVVTPPSNDAFSFAISPDGRQLTFVANGEKGSQLWMRSLDQATAQPLAGTEDAAFPFWAPDSRAVGFFAGGKLKRLDLSGGAPQVLADASSPRGGTWNHDGVIVFAPTTNTGLMRVMASGGSVTPVTSLSTGQGSHRWPQFLPDGRHLLFFSGLGQVQTHGVYLASLDGGAAPRVLPGELAAVYVPPGYLLQVNQGTLFAHRFDAELATVSGEPIPLAQGVGVDSSVNRSALSVSTTGVLVHRWGAASRRQLVWVDRSGKALGAAQPPDENSLAYSELTLDGRRAAVSRSVQGNVDVWLIDFDRGVTNRLTFDESVYTTPVWSADGSRVVFRSSRKGAFDLYEKPADSASDEQVLLASPQDKSPLDWSADGRFLLYATQDPKTGSDLWALPLAGPGERGDHKPFPVVQTASDDIQGQFSPDGRWMTYASNRSGRYEIYIESFPEPGAKLQVSTAGGSQPRWSRDDRELFYVAPDGRLMAVPIRPAPDGRTLVPGAPVPLFPTRLAGGGNISPAGYTSRAQYAVARDGRFLMNVSADDLATSPITVVLNWEAALKKR